MTSYLLRFDDLCPTMNWDVWEKIEHLLDLYDIRPIVAVVPNNKDPKLMIQEPRVAYFWERVRNWQEKNWIIAIHGFTHVYDSDDPGLLRINSFSEFAGHPYEVQRERMLAGLSIFRANRVNPVMWVAPAHSFDLVTLQVLKDVHIYLISDGFSFRAFKDSLGLCWIPQQLWNFKTMPLGLWTFCCHHNLMGERQLSKLSDFLRHHHKSFVREITPVSMAARTINMLDKFVCKLIWLIHKGHEKLCQAIVLVRALKNNRG